MDKIKITSPLDSGICSNLKAGDLVLLSGKIYTARDAAHLRLNDLISNGEPIPIDLKGQIIYYAGPSPARPGSVIGACGPTTSYRMDDLTDPLFKLGLMGMIGKGDRSDALIESMIAYGTVYFAAIGGAGALISSCVKHSEVVAFEELGPEAIRCLDVEDMPVVVVIDSKGNNLYRSEPKKYRKQEGDLI
ncbi:MAG TPA: Fe-S-containing hydro-lyase [Clostridiales bacterium UBA8960]|jgi:fumarate hydratase subunit beta|nr:Fe-S-containing hydro-lyase [Clostridiales bacterium UBA8960]